MRQTCGQCVVELRRREPGKERFHQRGDARYVRRCHRRSGQRCVAEHHRAGAIVAEVLTTPSPSAVAVDVGGGVAAGCCDIDGRAEVGIRRARACNRGGGNRNDPGVRGRK